METEAYIETTSDTQRPSKDHLDATATISTYYHKGYLDDLVSSEDDRMLGAPGLPREAEGLSGNDVCEFEGASREEPGVPEGFSDLGFMAEERPHGVEPLDTVGPDLVTEDDRLDGVELEGTADMAEGRLVGVADLDAVLLAAGTDDLDVCVEYLTGVDDRGGGAHDFEGKAVRGVGVEALVGFEAAVNVGRPFGVTGLDA
ncbi:hypothetical protein BHM03_00054812 [Ensete ventricosum]|nr:hypothetical protein BHM03_00054812 [Ensete ventricosum]